MLGCRREDEADGEVERSGGEVEEARWYIAERSRGRGVEEARKREREGVRNEEGDDGLTI